MRERLFGSVDEAAALDGLGDLGINYNPARAPEDGRAEGHWHVDSAATLIGREAPGSPEPGGAWEIGCRLVSRYEFADARILRAVYRGGDDLLGRNMLLEGRFYGLRFYLGVRVTGVIEETRDTGQGREQVWGWCYQTLQGHLEQGRLSYEVIKNLGTGEVKFRVTGYSRQAHIPSPVIRWGFRLFGRWTQERFYRNIQRRMFRLTQAAQRGLPPPVPTVRADGIVLAPSGVRPHPLERLARGWLHAGRQEARPLGSTRKGKLMATETHDILGVYLNDHLAGSTLGTELARRVAASVRHMPVSAKVLKELAVEAAEDRAALLEIMATLGVKVRGYKVYAAWAGEKVGRLKLNGHLLSRSPLSSLEELEILQLGVEGKGAGWRTLRGLAERDSRLDAGRLDELASRAARQADLLEKLRAAVAERIF